MTANLTPKRICDAIRTHGTVRIELRGDWHTIAMENVTMVPGYRAGQYVIRVSGLEVNASPTSRYQVELP